jgi:hypothetical protein
VRLSRDGIAGLVCLAGSLVLWWTSRGLPQPALVPIGPAFYPRILFGVTAALSLLLVLGDLWRRGDRPSAPAVGYRLVVVTFALFTAYVFLLPVVGYRVGTLMFVAGLQSALDPPQTWRAAGLVAVMAVGATVLTYYVFEVNLNVLLPRGRLTGF